MNRFPSFLNVVIQFVGILNESRKLFLKNTKLMFSVLLFPLLLNSLVILFNEFVLKPEMTNLTTKTNLSPTTDPTTPEYTANLTSVFHASLQVFVSSCIVALISFVVNLILAINIVHISANKDENIIKIKEIMVWTFKSWKGPLVIVTKIYITLFTFCYWFLCFIIYFPLVLISEKLGSLAAIIRVLWILFVVFEYYLAVVWNLSMVISILEDTYGFQALKKAAQIAKGMKPELFLFNLFFSLLSFVLAQIVSLIVGRGSLWVTLIAGLVLMSLGFVMRMFQLVTYTVAYFKCTSRQDNDVESARDVEYTKLSSNNLMGRLP